MSHLKKVDHITYACEQGSIERWAWFHIEVEGGTLINRIDDVRPDDPDSSMKIWCIDYGDFGIALVEGIDRAKKSHVTRFVERPRGDDESLRITFSQGAGRAFYEQIENAFAVGDDEPFIDFSTMPKTWRAPPPAPRASSG